jgi:gas vesicle protein
MVEDNMAMAENTKTISQSLRTATEKTEENIDQITAALSTLDSILQKTDTTLGQFLETTEEKTQTLLSNIESSIKDTIQTINSEITDLQNDVKAREVSINALMKEQEELSKVMKENLSTDLSKYYKELLEQMKDKMGEMVILLQENTTEISENLELTIRNVTNSLEMNLKNTMNNSQTMVDNLFSGFDKQMTRELEKVINEMGGHLTALSRQFVDDYGPLTDKLKKIVDISSKVEVR